MTEKLRNELNSIFSDQLSKIAKLVPSPHFLQALEYCLFNQGKLVRPKLVELSSQLFDVPRTQYIHVAAAVEFIHLYSLIHDDLPEMDNDDLRRGHPTLHKKFDVATAILVGDALQSMAFELLSHDVCETASEIKLKLVHSLACATGAAGMVGGQMLDLQAEGRFFQSVTKNTQYRTQQLMHSIQELKTGALLRFSVCAGGILGRASSEQISALEKYGRNIGIAFQLADDLLDVEGDMAQTGKIVGKDQGKKKLTFMDFMTPSEARTRLENLINEAMGYIEIFGERGEGLKKMANFIAQRNH